MPSGRGNGDSAGKRDRAGRDRSAHRYSSAEHGGLLFRIAADALKRRGVEPQPAALPAFLQPDAAQIALEHGSLARGTGTLGIFSLPLNGQAAAVRPELGALKHHPEARRTGNAGQPRTAMRALGLVARGAPRRSYDSEASSHSSHSWCAERRMQPGNSRFQTGRLLRGEARSVRLQNGTMR